MNPKPLRLLGLAYKAGKVVWGLDAVKIAKGQTRLILLANDAGAAVKREVLRLFENTVIPVETLPYDKQTLGNVLGKSLCAVLAVTDGGFAKSIDENIPR